jgi:hypothetical protein
VVLESRSGPSVVDLTALGPADGVDAWTVVQIVSGGLGQAIEVARPAAAGGTLRARVREVEVLAPSGQPPASQAGSAGELTERTVFADLVVIP